jgi:hypothetical protein
MRVLGGEGQRFEPSFDQEREALARNEFNLDHVRVSHVIQPTLRHTRVACKTQPRFKIM